MRPLHKFRFSSFFVHCLFSWPWFSHTQIKPSKQSWRLFKHTIFLRWSQWFHSLLFSTSERFSKLWKKFLKKKKWQQQGRTLNEFLSSNFSIIFLNLKVSSAMTSKRNSGFHETDSQISQRNLKRWMSWFVVKTIHASWILNSHGLTSRQCSKENLQLKNWRHWTEWPVKQAELQNLQERQSLKECLRSWHKTGKCQNLFQSPLDDLNCEKSILTRNRFSKRCNRRATLLQPTKQPNKKESLETGILFRFFIRTFECKQSLYVCIHLANEYIQIIEFCSLLTDSESEGCEWNIHKIWPQNRVLKLWILWLQLLWLHQQNIDMRYISQLRWSQRPREESCLRFTTSLKAEWWKWWWHLRWQEWVFP